MPPEIIEPPHRPHHGGGGLPRWLEWTTAISALVISVCSIGVALYNANIESRLLKANSYPYVVSGLSDASRDGKEQINIELLNNGVGPADERSLKIRLGDQYVSDVNGLIRAAMPPADADSAVALLKNLHDNEPTRFIPAHDHGMVFQIDKTPENAALWDRFDQALNARGVTVEFCYCSVFEECWAVANSAHKRVKACVRDPAREFSPKSRYAQPDPTSPLPRG